MITVIYPHDSVQDLVSKIESEAKMNMLNRPERILFRESLERFIAHIQAAK